MTRMEHFKVGDDAKDRMKVPSTFWALIKSMRLTPSAVLRHSNLPLTMCTRECELTTAELFRIWRSVHQLGKDATLGWKSFKEVKSEQFHPALLAALNARNYRESLHRLGRYKQLCGAQEFRFTELGNEFRVEVSWPFAQGTQPPALLLDANFALVMELGRRGTLRRLSAKRLELARARDRKDGLEEYFGCSVDYECRHDLLVLDTADVELPFIEHNEELLGMLVPQLEGQLQHGASMPRVHDQVRWVLRRLLSGNRPDVAMVAKELGMSERTLQRRITEEGTTFRQLLNETRHELAKEYLANDSVGIPEAAFLLGYEDVNSFYRAFRSWAGTTPAEWRGGKLSNGDHASPADQVAIRTTGKTQQRCQ